MEETVIYKSLYEEEAGRWSEEFWIPGPGLQWTSMHMVRSMSKKEWERAKVISPCLVVLEIGNESLSDVNPCGRILSQILHIFHFQHCWSQLIHIFAPAIRAKILTSILVLRPRRLREAKRAMGREWTETSWNGGLNHESNRQRFSCKVRSISSIDTGLNQSENQGRCG